MEKIKVTGYLPPETEKGLTPLSKETDLSWWI